MRLLVSHHSVSLVQACGWVVTIIIHYCCSSGLLAKSNSPSLESSSGWKISHMIILSKWHSKISHASNTFPTLSRAIFAFRYTILYHRDPLAPDNGRRKHSTTLEHRLRRNNKVNDVTMQGVPDRHGWEIILLQ